METSVKAAKVLVPPPPTESSDGEEAAPPPAACASSPSADSFDPMEEFNRQLEDIISTYGSAAGVLDKQSVVEAELEKMKKEAKEDVKVNIQSEVSLIMKGLNKMSSPEKKLEDLVRQCAELAAQRRVDEKKLCVLQQTTSLLLDERQQLQAERRLSCSARSQLETMCRELQGHYSKLRDQTLQRCRDDEEKRKEMTGHFQSMLTEIQEQIEQHSSRNDKLCRENSSLTDKLESLMGQCEQREESLEKINQRRDLQHKLTEAKLQQSNAQLAEAEEKHRREKEYLLREAIDKTKKCFAMKEQELAMKKKLLVTAAEWKLQAQTYREQGTVMQAQLTLYGQKFDEFQETLSKSNEIYVRFKNEMENMSEKMKKMEKESNLWKKRFENCNKALTDMIEERSEKNKEYEVFVLKIHKLEKLCQALQEERGVLYSKIKEVQQANANLPSKIFTSSPSEDVPVPESVGLLSPDELQELQQIQEEDPALTEDMTRLREQQAKLNEFAASLLATSSNNEQEDNKDSDTEEDAMASMFIQFTTKTKVKEQEVSVPEQEAAEEKVEEEPKLAMLTPEAPTSVEDTAAKAEPEAETVETPINNKEVQPVKPEQQQPAELASTTEPEKVELSQPTDTKPEAAEAEIKHVASVPAEPVKEQAEAPTGSEPAPPSENTPNTSNTESSKKQAPKKKKKKNTKNAS